MAKRKSARCAKCSTPMWPSKNPKPAAEYVCSACRGWAVKPSGKAGVGLKPRVDATCARCGQPWRRKAHRDQDTCPACRLLPRPCGQCGTEFTPHMPNVKRCAGCRTKGGRQGSRYREQYNAEHARQREAWVPRVLAGGVQCHAVECLMASREIFPEEPWDMGHTPDRTAWTGPEHPSCNRSEGARRGAKLRRAQRLHEHLMIRPAEHRLRLPLWAQRDFERLEAENHRLRQALAEAGLRP